MKYTISTIMKALMAMIVFPLLTKAHEGGHFHKGDEKLLNTWELKTGKYIKGNFSKGDDQLLYLEQLEGKIVSIPIEDLSEQDKSLARFKIKRSQTINILNSIPFKRDFNNQNKAPNFTPLLFIICIIFSIIMMQRMFKNWGIFHQKWYQISLTVVFGLASIYACKKANVQSTTNNGGSGSTSVIPRTFITFLDSAFAGFKPAISTNFDANYYYVASTGFPNHNMMIGITSWQQQVPIPQSYNGTNSWSIPLQPEYATSPLSTKSHLMKGAVAIAVNGIPIFNALNNRGEDSYLIGELDNWGGHCGRADDYHYHAAPMHLSTNPLLPIAFALDGFAVYGTKEPDGTTMMSLDTCHGHIGKNNIYHYHGTTNYPYVVGAMKGKVSLDPSTPAPEDQILPQAFAKPVRPATTPLKDAVITDFKSTGMNAYSLTYRIANKYGYVNYSWDANNKYTYTLIDTSGKSTTTTYQR